MPGSSTKPLGATSYKETAFGIIPRMELLQLEIQGTKKGLDFIFSLIDEGGEIEITPVLIVELHAICFKWIFPEWAGKYRVVQVTYSGKEAPKYFQIPQLVKNICDDLKVRLENLPSRSEEEFVVEAIGVAAWFQHQFVHIHPFLDYNGRLARMLTSLLFLKLKLPPSEIHVETEIDRQRYLEALRSGDSGDMSDLEELIEQALIESLVSK